MMNWELLNEELRNHVGYTRRVYDYEDMWKTKYQLHIELRRIQKIMIRSVRMSLTIEQAPVAKLV